VLIRRSKTDQEAAGQTIGVPYGSDPATCPVRAQRAWLEEAGITDGPIFRRIDRHGILHGERIGGHSLRAGLITSAMRGGATERDTMRHSRHRSIAVFRGYVRDVGLFEANAAAKAGLYQPLPYRCSLHPNPRPWAAAKNSAIRPRVLSTFLPARYVAYASSTPGRSGCIRGGSSSAESHCQAE
jgi:hypothetical protein